VNTVLGSEGVNPAGVLTIALTFGFTITVCAFSTGHISGGHINPAVTIALLLQKNVSWIRAAVYIVAQMLGACMGAGLLRALTPTKWQALYCLGATTLDQTLVTYWQAFFLEFLFTFVLLFVIGAASDFHKSNQALVPLAIGLTVFISVIVGGPFTGPSLNPARSFGPALVSMGIEYVSPPTPAPPVNGSGLAALMAGVPAPCSDRVWVAHWIYWVGPILGAIAGTAFYKYSFANFVDATEGDELEAQYRMPDVSSIATRSDALTRSASVAARPALGLASGAPRGNLAAAWELGRAADVAAAGYLIRARGMTTAK
jgi:MIP family channel proteins